MRFRASWILLALVLGSAAGALAQDAGADKKREREPFIKRDGQVADNEQLGGEPSLTETEQQTETAPPEECDLDCIEAELADEDAREQARKGTLEVARETGAVSSEAATESGDALAAEPSTTSLAEAVVDVPDDWTLPTRLGPVRIKVGKTDDWIGIGLATQLLFEYEQQFPTGGFPKESTETLQFRRIRFTLSSSFIDGRIQSRFQINLTPSAFELIDMWFSFTRFKFATFRIGQFKIPYDRYRAQSFAALALVDWAPTTRMFGSERQVGGELLASGGFFNLEYAFGLFTGVNARASQAVGITEVYGDTPQNPSDLGSGEVVSEFHPELVGRVAKNFGEINTDTNSDTLRTRALRHSVGAGIAWDARPTAIEDLALRLSAEWLGKIRGIHMNVITYLAWYEPWQGGKILVGPFGLMAETGYRFNVVWGLALRYSVTYITPSLRSDSRSYGQAQIMNAADPAQAIAQYGRNGDQTTNQQLALAGTAYVIGNSLKVVTETTWETQLWNTGRRNGFAFAMQLQLLF